MAPDGWRAVNLDSLAQVNPEQLTGGTDPDYLMEYLDIAAIEQTGIIGRSRPLRFAEAPSRARRVVRKGDILVSTVRPQDCRDPFFGGRRYREDAGLHRPGADRQARPYVRTPHWRTSRQSVLLLLNSRRARYGAGRKKLVLKSCGFREFIRYVLPAPGKLVPLGSIVARVFPELLVLGESPELTFWIRMTLPIAAHHYFIVRQDCRNQPRLHILRRRAQDDSTRALTFAKPAEDDCSQCICRSTRWGTRQVAGKILAWSVSNTRTGIGLVGYVGVYLNDQEVMIGQHRRAGNRAAAFCR